METETLSFPGNHINGTKEKKKKRKLSLILDESSEALKAVKKKKLLKNGVHSQSSEHDSAKYLHYKKTKDYVEIDAKPEFLPPPPQIFQSKQWQNNKPDISENFLLSFLSAKALNSDVRERFSHFSVRGFNNVDYNVREGNKKGSSVEKEKEKETEKEGRRTVVEEEEESLGRETVGQEESQDHSEENVEVECHVEVYQVAEKNSLILHVSHPSKFSFSGGEVKTTILAGEVEVLGYTLSHSSGNTLVKMSSPNFCTPLIIETKASLRQQLSEDVQFKLKELLSKDDWKTVLNNFKPSDSLLLVEQSTTKSEIVLNKYFDSGLFPKSQEEVQWAKAAECLQSFFCFNLREEEKFFKKNGQWDKIPLGQCTVICGGKGVGKSTLLRYYINKLLAVGEKVLVVDLDPGQPEFTLPGCIYAVTADEPVIGPSFTHIREPVIMTCFGDVNVSNNPTKYLECVRYVVESCRQNEELQKMKWLVNTMGFSKGLGVDLTISILKLLNPNTVVQIRSSEEWINFPFFLTPGTINPKPGFRSIPLDDVELSHDLRVVSSSADLEKKQTHGGLTRKQLRDIMSIAYFSKMASPPYYNLNAVQPYLISFSKVYLGVELLLRPSDVVKAFNGNAVSLSHFEPDGEEVLSVGASGNDYFQVVVKPRVGRTLGIGLIRGIDCQEKKFYVLTHLETEVLKSVNCLTLRRVSPPHSLFTRQEAVRGQPVYTTVGTEDIIRSSKRTFRVRV